MSLPARDRLGLQNDLFALVSTITNILYIKDCSIHVDEVDFWFTMRIPIIIQNQINNDMHIANS